MPRTQAYRDIPTSHTVSTYQRQFLVHMFELCVSTEIEIEKCEQEAHCEKSDPEGGFIPTLRLYPKWRAFLPYVQVGAVDLHLPFSECVESVWCLPGEGYKDEDKSMRKRASREQGEISQQSLNLAEGPASYYSHTPYVPFSYKPSAMQCRFKL